MVIQSPSSEGEIKKVGDNVFNTYEFIYNEIPSSMYGLFICDFDGNNNENVSFGNKADIIERKVNNRVSPLHFGVDYNKEPLSFKLVFASYNELDRWELREIANWLTGYQEYKWLYIEQPDMEEIGYKCLITELTPLHVGWAPYAFEATIRCDCPYAYGPKRSVELGSNSSIFCEGTAKAPAKPMVEINVSRGSACVLYINHEDGSQSSISFEGLPTNIRRITIDNENEIITCDDTDFDIYSAFQGDFLKLKQGENQINIFNIVRTKLDWREYYNVGA